MKTKNAEKELKEFVVIGKIDPTNEYHLGTPILCKPDISDSDTKNDIKRCKYIKIDEVEADPNKYSVLVLKFGGPDLKALCEKYLTKYLDKNIEKRVDKFWLEVHHLLKGLKFFKDNGIVHNDLKPQNILFNSKSGKLKFIDFGLMRSKKDILDTSNDSNNFLGIYHWSYPFDCGFMNKNNYNKYKHRNKNRRDYWKNELSELIVSNSNKNTLALPINRPDSFKILFSYIDPNFTIPNASTQYGYISSFFDGLNTLIDNESYSSVLNKITDSIDIFGLGFTMQYILNCFKNKNAINLEFYTRLTTFFHKMYDFNPNTRVIDIDSLITEYENILLELGILTRLKKSFKNHNIIKKEPAPKAIIKEAKIDSISPPKVLSEQLSKLADKDAIEIVVNCGENKEFNPITNRCVKKCKDGWERDSNFKCVSLKSKKTRKTASKTSSKSKTEKKSSYKRIKSYYK
jgi:serine/threonine protein kinase